MIYLTHFCTMCEPKNLLLFCGGYRTGISRDFRVSDVHYSESPSVAGMNGSKADSRIVPAGCTTQKSAGPAVPAPQLPIAAPPRHVADLPGRRLRPLSPAPAVDHPPRQEPLQGPRAVRGPAAAAAAHACTSSRHTRPRP